MRTDSRIILAVVILLGLVVMLGLGGTIWLISTDTESAQLALVTGLTGTALGSLGSLLATTRTEPDGSVAAAAQTSYIAGATSAENDLLKLAAAEGATDVDAV